ncbi:MAG: UvrD-helicase domain-containing protein [Spirochaetes bacterium]|nr:UvrD-helicase domain-containing protein [Spirochaetota bacterium]
MGKDNLWYLDGLNPPQREAVLHKGEPLLILAGAGSGKTRVITVKIAHLILHEGVNPRSILAVTFTNKAAQEMKERAIQICPQAEGVLIKTFHSFCAWFLRRNATLAGLDPHFSIYDEEDSLALLQSLYPDRERRMLSSFAFAIGRAKDYGLSPSDPLDRISLHPDFGEIYQRYSERLRQIGSLDFGDLILRSLEILRQFPEVKRRTQDRFRILLVDEYQDSNVAQHQLLKELYSPEAYICVVGDDDQSIYRFRGAEVGNLLTFADEFPGTRIIRLEQNYRSTEKILQAASEVVRNNRGRLGKTLWTNRKGGKEPLIFSCMDQDEEARICADLIQKHPNLETAILYRINAQSRVFETLFLREGIPYRLVGTVRFYEREEVKDALAFLRFLQNPKDEVSFRRIVNKPSRGIGLATVDAILSHQEAVTEGLLRAMEVEASLRKGKTLENLNGFLTLCHRFWEELETLELSRFVELVIRESGLEEYHRTQDQIAGSQKLRNLEELVNAAAGYPRGRDGLAQFLEDIELDAAAVTDEEHRTERPMVTLITMHNTKGLEFDRVIVTGMEEGLFPRGGDESEEDLEEERRLFYVAITRAKEELYFTFCRTRRLHGRIQEVEPSRFLRELPDSVWEQSKPFVNRVASTSFGKNGFEPGTLVYHEEYGQGMVIRQWEKDGILVVLVRFENGRVAQFIPRYEKRLEKVTRDG